MSKPTPPAATGLRPEDRQIIPGALLGTLAIEAGLVAQSLSQLQNRVGDMLLKPELDDDDIAQLQLLDQLTQRVADLSSVLDVAGQSIDNAAGLASAPLLVAAKLAHTRSLISGLDLGATPDTEQASSAEEGSADSIMFF